MNENLLPVIVVIFAIAFHCRQRFDIFWIIPAVAAVLLGGKAQTICLLLAEAIILTRIFSARKFQEGLSGTLTAQLSTFALLSVAIVPVPASFEGTALLSYVFVRLLGFPLKENATGQSEVQTYELLLPMLAWSMLGFQLQEPANYIWASAFVLLSVFSILSYEPSRAFLGIFIAVQCFVGPVGPIAALIAALFLGRASSQVLSSLMAFLSVVMLVNKQEEAVAWAIMAIFSMFMGFARAGLKLPVLTDFKIKSGMISNIKELSAATIFFYYAHTIGIFENIQSPFMSLGLAAILAEWVGRKHFPKKAWFERNRDDNSILSKMRKKWQRQSVPLTNPRAIDYSFRSLQAKERPMWIEAEAVPIGLAIAVVWGLWLWLY